MYVSKTEIIVPEATSIDITEDSISIELSDGRTISVPISWYPRLVYATQRERDNWEIIGSGQGIHWPDLDEDLSIEGFLAGRKSGETQDSLRQWLTAKKEGRGLALYELNAYEKEREPGDKDIPNPRKS